MLTPLFANWVRRVLLFRPWIWPPAGQWDRPRPPLRPGLLPRVAQTQFPWAAALAFPARPPLSARTVDSCPVLRISEQRSVGDRAAGAPRKCALFRTISEN